MAGLTGIRGLSGLSGLVARNYIQEVLSTNPIAYWPLYEASGTTAACLVNSAQNGTYNRDVSIMGTQVGIGDGNTAPVFDGSQDRVNVYSVPVASSLDPLVGSISGWAKISSATWVDGVLGTILQFGVDGNNYIRINKRSSNNRLRFLYVAGGTVTQINELLTVTDWFHYTLTWSVANDEVKAYINSIQFGSTQTGLGSWVGNFNNQRCVLGAANTSGTNPFTGGLAHVAVYDEVLT